MSRKKTMTLFSLVAMVALLSLGLAYANWTESLTVTGTVRTGDLSVIFRGDSSGTNCTVSPNGATLTVDMDGAYPGKKCTVNAVILNNGSVPAKYAGVTLSSVPPEITVNFTECTPEPTNETLDVGQAVRCTGTIGVTEAAHQNSSYSFQVNVNVTTP